MKLDKANIIKILAIIGISLLFYTCIQNITVVWDALGEIYGFVAPFVIGCSVAFFINVPMRFIENKIFSKWTKLPKLKRGVSLLLAILFLVVIIALVLLVVIPQMIDTISSIDFEGYFVKIRDYIVKLLEDYPEATAQIEKFANEFVAEWDAEIKGFVDTVIGWLTTGISSTINIAGDAINSVVSGFIGLIFAIYLLLGKDSLARHFKMALYAVFPENVSDKIIKVAKLSDSSFSNFISGQCLEACILGVLFAISMWIFGMPYVALISILVAFTSLVPLVGGFVGCFIGAFLILMQDPMQAVWFVILFVVVQQIEGNLIYPRVVGESVGLPPIWVLTLITIGGKLMGIVGIIIVIPIGSVIYSLFKEFVHKKIDTKSDRVKGMFPPIIVQKFKFKDKKVKAKAPKKK